MDYQPVIAWVKKNVKRDLESFPIFAPESMREALAGYAKLREVGGFLGEDLKVVNGEYTFRSHKVIFVTNATWSAFWFKAHMVLWHIKYGFLGCWWHSKAVFTSIMRIWRI